MLTNEEKQLLNYLIPEFKAGNDMICFDKVAENVNMSAYETDIALRHLESKDYLKIKRYKNGGFIRSLTHKALHYNELESSATPVKQTNIFNAPVSGSAIGNSGNITISNGASFQEVRDFVQAHSISDSEKAEIDKILTYIETLEENDTPLKRGFLSKFGNILSKHHWLPEMLMKLLFQYFME